MVVSRPLVDVNGVLTTSKQEQLQIWTEYYSKLLSVMPPATQQQLCDCSNHAVREDMDTQCPDGNEIVKAIKSLRMNKAPGPDNIPPELLTADPDTSSQLILPIIENFWSSESLPSILKEGIIIKLPKKGNLSECKNWRGISLLNAISKILSHIVARRIGEKLEPLLRREQAGFRPHRSCIDHVNSLRVIVEQSVEWRTPLYLGFIDFERAFDTIHHDAIWCAMECKGVPRKLINLTKALYDNASCRILHEDQLSDEISILAGVRQGCVLSPLLFNIVLDVIMSSAMKNSSGIQWGMQGNLLDLEYADDICLLTHKHAHMRENIHAIHAFAARAGLKINVGKTKLMSINTTSSPNIEIEGKVIENVSSFMYLGSVINDNGGTKEDILHRIKKGRSAFGALDNVWRSQLISKQTKLRIFNSNVKSIILYGCETWNVALTELKALQVFTNRCLRRIMRIFWPNVISNEALWSATKQKPVSQEIRERKWKWIGHTLRKPREDIARQALEWNPQGSRRRGRPANTWKRSVEAEAASMGRSWSEIKYLALDRSEWNNFVVALCSSQE